MTRRIVPPQKGLKDETGSYLAPIVVPGTVDLNPEVSLDEVYRQQLIILSRETKRLLTASAAQQLTKDEGVAFERCVKITREFKKEEREYLDSLTPEQLEALNKE